MTISWWSGQTRVSSSQANKAILGDSGPSPRCTAPARQARRHMLFGRGHVVQPPLICVSLRARFVVAPMWDGRVLGRVGRDLRTGRPRVPRTMVQAEVHDPLVPAGRSGDGPYRSSKASEYVRVGAAVRDSQAPVATPCARSPGTSNGAALRVSPMNATPAFWARRRAFVRSTPACPSRY